MSKHGIARSNSIEPFPLNQVDAIDEIHPLMMHEDTAANTLPTLPAWFVIVLVLLPLGVLSYEGMSNKTQIFDRMNRAVAKKNAFMNARTQIKNIFAQQQVSLLYTVFVHLFATRCSVDQHLVNQEFIYDRLKKSGMGLEELAQWDQFYNQLNELMFSKKQVNHNEYQILRHYADRWIDRLESVI